MGVGNMEIGKELEEYVRSVCVSIKNGITDELMLQGAIEFELAVVNKKEASGGLKLHVLDAKGEYNKKEISKIKFKIASKDIPLGGGKAPKYF